MTKMMKTSAEGRKCKFPDCNRVLSIYNHEQYCHLHLYQMSEEEKIWRSIHPEPSDELVEKLRRMTGSK